jgi:hypothetical protein
MPPVSDVDRRVRLDDEWNDVLAHRSRNTGDRQQAARRFIAAGVLAKQVRLALADGGDELYRAASRGGEAWSSNFGGPVAVALLAAEISALTSHLNSRAAGIRSVAVDLSLDDLSAVTVAARLGVSRQKVYEIARGGLGDDYITLVPWATP